MTIDTEAIRRRLLEEATQHSDFTKLMQARRTAEYRERGDTDADYRGMEPEETIYWNMLIRLTHAAPSCRVSSFGQPRPLMESER
jgi:hypothetical protein